MPFQPQPLLQDLTQAGTIGALNATTTLQVSGVSSAKILITGTWVGTIQFQQSVDGVTWNNVNAFSGTTGKTLTGIGTTVNDLIIIAGIAGSYQVQAIFTSYTSGTADITIRASTGVSATFTDSSDGPVTPGTAAVLSALIGGQYNSSLPTLTTGQQSALQSDSSGRLLIGSVASLPLPSGAATSANQSTEITSLQLIDNPVGSSTGGTAGSSSFLSGAIYNLVPPALSNGEQVGLQADINSNLLVKSDDNTGSGTIAALNSSVVVNTEGCSSVSISLTGTWVATLQLEAQAGDNNWTDIPSQNISDALFQSTFTSNAFVVVPCGGFSQIRLTATAYTSGTATITYNAGIGANFINQGVPAGLGNAWPVVLANGSGNAISSYNSQIEVADVLNVSSQYRAQSVTTTAAEALGASTILTNRKLLHITPTNGTIYWGYNSSVTTTTGSPLFPNNTLWLSVGASTHVYVIAAATTDSRIGELS